MGGSARRCELFFPFLGSTLGVPLVDRGFPPGLGSASSSAISVKVFKNGPPRRTDSTSSIFTSTGTLSPGEAFHGKENWATNRPFHSDECSIRFAGDSNSVPGESARVKESLSASVSNSIRQVPFIGQTLTRPPGGIFVNRKNVGY